MKKILILLIILFVLQLIACSDITQEAAEAKALRFVEERVKFYTTQNSSDLDFPEYDFSSITSYKEKNVWVVVFHIKTVVSNDTRKTDVIIEVDARNGEILKFNNQPVRYQ